jgi:PmbA protein
MTSMPTDVTTNGHTLTSLAGELLERATRQGASAADVVVAEGDNFSVQVRLTAVDRLTRARETRAGIRIVFGREHGIFDDDDIGENIGHVPDIEPVADKRVGGGD